MLFQRRFHDGIRDGSVRLTFRAWATPRAAVGATHRLGPHDAIEVEAVERVTVGAITAAEARRAGFASREELVDTLRRSTRANVTAGSTVYRVAFRHVPLADPRAARRADASAAALDEVAARLEGMDERSARGPWTTEVLRLLGEHPRVAASELAPRLGRETRAFKADVRRLGELGLTESHEVGYSLSPRGRALLARLDRR